MGRGWRRPGCSGYYWITRIRLTKTQPGETNWLDEMRCEMTGWQQGSWKQVGAGSRKRKQACQEFSYFLLPSRRRTCSVGEDALFVVRRGADWQLALPAYHIMHSDGCFWFAENKIIPDIPCFLGEGDSDSTWHNCVIAVYSRVLLLYCPLVCFRY